MKYLKLYEGMKEDVPYYSIDHLEYYNLLHGSIDRTDMVPYSNRVPFSKSDKKILINILEDVVNYHKDKHQGDTFISYEFFYPDVHLRIEFRSELITQTSGRLITYGIETVNDDWFLVTELSRKIRTPLHSTERIFDSSNTWKCDQLYGLLEFLKFKNIIK